MKQLTDEQVLAIYNILASARFEKWHDGEFMDYIRGEQEAKSKEEILEDIRVKFQTVA